MKSGVWKPRCMIWSKRKQIEITWLEHATWRTLQRAMRGGPWHILHFVGHGGFDRVSDEGILAFEDEDGEPNRLPATQLARLLADHTTLRLVILNSCEGAQGGNTDVFSSTASILVRHGIAGRTGHAISNHRSCCD